MANSFEPSIGYSGESEIILDRFKFKSVSTKYINKNYKRIGSILGIEGEGLGNIKRQAKEEKQLPDIQEQEELSLEQINYYREHYGFPPLTHDEYEAIKAQNISDEKSEEGSEVNRGVTDLDVQQETTLAVESKSGTTPASERSAEGEVNEAQKLTREKFGHMPEDPYDIKNNDLDALNNLFASKPDQFPNGRYVDIRNWDDWTPITVVKPENINDPNLQWSITKGNNNELIGEFPSKEDAEAEFDRIKNEDKQKALDLLRKARNFAIGEGLESPWIDSGDVSIETPSPAEASIPSDTESGRPAEDEEVSKYKLPGAEALQAELDILTGESVQQHNSSAEGSKSARLKEKKYTGDSDIESNLSALELDIFRERAQEAINKYQSFHQSFPKKYRTPEIQEQYRRLEKEAWDRVEALAYQLGGNISQELPQLRNILESHRDLNDSKDAKNYLLQQENIIVNEEGNITHIVDDEGNEVKLNRPRTFEEIFAKSRPVRILFRTNEEGKKIGYVVDGLNENTLTWIETTLSGNTIPQAEIRDETGEPANPTTEKFGPPETNPEVSAENLDILESYRKQGFNEAQLAFIKQVIDAGDTTDQIALYAKPEYEVAQMIVEREKKLNPNLDISQYEGLPYWQQTWIITGIRAGHTPEQIALYAKLGVNSNEIKEIQSDIQNGLTIEQINEKQIKKRAEGYLNIERGFSRNNLIRQLESEGFTNEQATQAIDSMDIDWNQQAIKKSRIYLQSRPETKENWSKNELIEQLKFKKFTNEQAIFAVNNISDYDWKEEEVTDHEAPEQTEGGEPTSQVSLDDLRLAYARAEELYNRNRNDESAKLELERLRGEYNQTVEEVIGIMVAQGLELEIHRFFTQEVENLREERVLQSQELQSGFEKAINPLKERFVNFAIKHKKTISRLNLLAFGVGTTLALTGFGLPVAGGLAVLRRSVSSLMSGVSSRELARAGFEDGDINLFKGKIKWQAAIPKLVGESLQEGYIKKANDNELSTKLSTLEAYYRLNGGKFTNESQQTAYEAILNELGTRVQHDSIAKQVKQESSSTQGASEKFTFSSPEYNQQYTSRLLTTLSEKRITELQKQQQKRKIADIIGFATGGTLLTIGTLLDAHRASVASKPDTLNPLEQPSGTSQPNIETTTPSATNPSIPEGTGEAVPQNLSPEQLQDISQLSKGETLWGEIAKQLGPNASPDQIQHALENYVQSGVGQNTIFQLAQGTEGGRGLLAQWGIDNANEMASLSKEQLYEISRYLAPGELEGISNFNIDHLEAFQPAEYVAPSPTEAPTGSTEPPAPPAAEAPVTSPSTELPPVASTEFTRGVSEALGATNLTETQLQEAIYSFATSEQGSTELYNQIISNEEGARFLSGFGVNNAADFANLRPDEVYEIAQTVGVENLDKLLGFELNEIILSKFEDAPDMVELARGTRPLDVVNQYISSEIGNLPYDSTLGQQVLNTYLDTADGKQWLYDAIVNNPDVDNQNIQLFREYLRFKDIKSPEDFVSKFNWAEFSGNKNIPTSAFWNQTRLPNGGARLQPLSTFLKPSQMTGIKEAVRQVLNR